jgi:VWFA-related protein
MPISRMSSGPVKSLSYVPAILYAAIFLGIMAAAAFPLAAQIKPKADDQPPVRPTKPLSHEVSVALKLIQVVVMDKNGNPVTDLKKEDFSLTDGGRAMKLTEFEKHDLKLTVPADKSGPDKTAETPPAAPILLNRKIIFLFDFSTGDYQGVRKAAEAALHFVDTKLVPGDEVGVITLSFTRGFQVPELLTTDHKKIRAIIKSFGLRDGAGSALDITEKTGDQVAAGAAPDARKDNPLSMDHSRPIQMGNRRQIIVSYFDRMEGLAQALRYIPGKKNLILFSGGITTGQLPSGNAADVDSDLRHRLTKINNEFATSDIAVYAIYTSEMTAALDMKTPAASLIEMAETTGGKYFGYVQNYAEHFEKIQTLTGSFYVLGYPLNETRDGAYHKVKVSVNRPGCKVRAQSGYFNPREFSDYSDMEKLIHLVDLALAEKPLLQNPIRFPMSALVLSQTAGDNIGIAADLPWESFREAGLGKVEILRLAFNSADEIIDSRRTVEDIGLRKDKSAVLASFLSAPPGRVKCRVVVRDLETGKAAVAGTSLTIPGPADLDVRMEPPLFLRPEKGKFMLKEPASGQWPPGLQHRTPAEAFFFDPAQYLPDYSTTLIAASEILAVVSCTGPTDSLGAIKITLTLFDPFKNEAQPIPLVLVQERSSDGARIFFLRFKLPDAEPDDYRLIFTAEGSHGPLSQIVRDFAIEKGGGLHEK